MKKTKHLFFMACVMMMGVSADAQIGLKANEKSPIDLKIAPKVQSQFPVIPLKSEKKSPSQLTTYDILVSEDFSGFNTGSADVPDTTHLLASQLYEPGIYIDPSMTKDGTWCGNFVYSAGGMAYLKTPNAYLPAFLATPLGDYSGDLHISFRAKAKECWFVSGYNEDGSEEWSMWTGSSLGFAVMKGNYTSYTNVDCDDTNRGEIRLYPDQGWTRVNFTLSNYSADSDGFVMFYTEEAVLIDDIEISVEPNFIASPARVTITDFQPNQFTLKWDPVRKAYNYYVDLYTKEYTSEEGESFSIDFEEGTVSEPWQTSATEFADGLGEDGTKALIMHNDETFTFPTTGGAYEGGRIWMKVIDPANPPSEEDPYWMYYINGQVKIDAYSDSEGWKTLGSWGAYNLAEGAVADLANEIDNLSDYSCLRLQAYGFDDGAYLLIDNAELQTGRTMEFVPVEGENSADYGGDYTFYDSTYDTEYTFTDLDPEKEYYYAVRSHYVNMFSDRKYVHALGVSAPVAKLATDIDSRGSFTANWESAPKATGYTVTLYGVNKIDSNQKDCTLMEESFNMIDEDVTLATSIDEPEALGNTMPTSLDDITHIPGWSGMGNLLVQGMLGCQSSEWETNYIQTPEVYTANGNDVTMLLEAYGSVGDQLILNINGTNYALDFVDNGEGKGFLNGTMVVPFSGETFRIMFSSTNKQPFFISNIRFSQDVKAGDVVRSWIQTAETSADELSYTFNNLDYDFPLYGYEVVSQFRYSDTEYCTSLTPSEFIFVNIDEEDSFQKDKNDATGIVENQVAADSNKVLARYAVDGRMLSEKHRGLNIVRMSDGSVRKVLVK